MTYLPGTEAIPPRVAYAIGRHVGGAVARNQLRRRLRSIVSDLAGSGSVAPGSYLIRASAPATELSFSVLSGHVTAAFAAFAGAESSFQGGVAP